MKLWSVAKCCLYHEWSNHYEWSYEPKGDMCAIEGNSAQDPMSHDYFCRIGATHRLGPEPQDPKYSDYFGVCASRKPPLRRVLPFPVTRIEMINITTIILKAELTPPFSPRVCGS